LYNKEEWVGRAMKSARSQTFTALEIVVVDDCSTDKSREIVREHAREDPRVRLLCLPVNRGTHVARSHAVLHSVGIWILMLEPDDELYPDIAEKLWSILRRHDTDIIMFRGRVWMNGQWPPARMRLPRQVIMNHDDLVRYYYADRLNVWIWGKLIRSSVYQAGLLQLNETERNMRITAGDDRLHSGMVYLNARSMVFLASLYGYSYYIETPGNSFSKDQELEKKGEKPKIIPVVQILRRHYQLAGVGDNGFLNPF
jgi:glycosyltransferase involved in cell wall biosynthesis